jgi:peroxiredoxin
MRTTLVVLLCTATLFAAGEDSGRRAPGFALPDSKMQVYDLADYRGKVVVLELMQTACAHCIAFADVLARVQRKYGDKVEILTVVASAADNAKTVAQYISAHDITYPVLFDAGQMAFSYMRKMSFDTPHVFLIDANGIIRNDWDYNLLTRDIFEGNGLMSEIDGLLSAKAASPAKK